MLLIARRYLLSRKSHSVVNIIAWVSIVSLLLPVAAVIVLLSIFNGFGVMVTEMESLIEGDLTLRLREGKFFEMSDIDSDKIREVEGVESLSFITEQTLLIEHNTQSAVVTLRGVDDDFLSTIPLDEAVQYGEFSTHEGGVVLGHSLALRLGIRSFNDATIKLYALKTGRLQNLLPMGGYSSVEGDMRGIFLTDQESEDRYAFASQDVANHLVGRDSVASRVVIALRKGANIGATQRAIGDVVGEDFRVESRSELNPMIYQIIRYEKMGVLLICSFMMLLASFSLLGALTMLIIEKRGDVTTLRAIGLTRGGVARIFILEGALMSGVAIGVGIIIGVTTTLIQQHFGIIELPSSTMRVTAYPVELHILDIIGVAAIAAAIAISITLFVVQRELKRSFH